MNLCIACLSQDIYCPSKHFFIYGLAAVVAITKHKTEYLNNCYTFDKLLPVNKPSCDKQWCPVSFRLMSYLIGPRPNVPSVAKFIWSEKILNKKKGKPFSWNGIKHRLFFSTSPLSDASF
jgi:hypothetical protein